MPVSLSRTLRMALALAVVPVVGTLLVGCSSFNSATQRFAGSLAPYKVAVVQGNFVSREQVEALQPGMSRQQVQAVLGSPLIASAFHADRWDYVFTLRRQGVAPQERRLTVFFKDNLLARHEGDTMPTEAEFVSTLDVRKREGKIPELEASEERLRQFAPRSAPPQPESTPAPATATAYPPLEPPAR